LERSSQVTKFGEFEVDPLPDWQPVQAVQQNYGETWLWSITFFNADY